jgi:hypothetical protein
MTEPVVDRVIARFDELLTKQPSIAQAYTHALRLHGILDEKPRRVVLRPYVLDEGSYAAVVASTRSVLRGFTMAADQLARDADLRRSLGIPEYLEPLIAIDAAHGAMSQVARLDGYLADGELKFLEYNSEPRALHLQYEAQRAWAELPVVAELARELGVRTIDPYERFVAALGARPTIAVIKKTDWLGQDGTFQPMAYAAARGIPVLLADPEQLEYADGALTAAGTRIDIVAFVDWSTLLAEPDRLEPVLRAAGEGTVRVLNGLSRGLLCSYKLVFEVLSAPDYASLFPSDVATALARHIPWTRVMRERKTEIGGQAIDLIPYVIDHRERFVIKPAGGAAGRGVTLGSRATTAEWAAAVKRAIGQQMVVQEIVVPDRRVFPIADSDGRITFEELVCEVSPHVWAGDQVDGALCRVGSNDVLGDERGSGALWIVTPENHPPLPRP